MIALVATLTFSFSHAQKAKYKAVQGMGYLHTQVTILLSNWESHPLSEGQLDEFQKEYRQHFIEEIEHDEEWVAFMLVEDNLLFQFEEHIDADVEAAIEDNLEFYRKVIAAIKEPELMEDQLEDLKNELQSADSRLYDQIFPALVK